MKLIIEVPDIDVIGQSEEEYGLAVHYRLEAIRRLLGRQYGFQHVKVMRGINLPLHLPCEKCPINEEE